MTKRQQWDLIVGNAPDLARWMSELRKAFGKPMALRVELLESGAVVESGKFEAYRIMFDGKARMRYGKR